MGTKISAFPSSFTAQGDIANNDVIAVVDTSATTTKKTTADVLAQALVRLGIEVGETAPSTNLYTGKPWMDTSSAGDPILKVYNGTSWNVVSVRPTSIVTSPGNSAPSTPSLGTLWLDTSATPVQLKAWDGAAWTQIDPDAVNRTASTGSAILPVGTTAQRDGSPAAGYLRYNSTLSQFEGYNGSAWGAVGGGATGGAGSYAFYENDITITASYTITTNKNAMTAGPVVVDAGVTVTVPSGSTWTVV